MALAGMLAAAAAAVPSAASADCDVPDDGMPEEAFLSKLGPGGPTSAACALRSPKRGIAIGGTYYGEAFVNSGGFNQGGKYDGVLDVAIDADMHKLGFWKGLCFHTNGFQIHGQSITADNIGSLMPVAASRRRPRRACSSSGSSSTCSTTSSRSNSASLPPTPNSYSPRAAASSSTAPGAGRRSLQPTAERRSCLSAGHAWRARRHHAERQVRSSWSASITAIPLRPAARTTRRSATMTASISSSTIRRC